MAIIEALIGPLGGIVAAVVAVALAWLRGRQTGAQARDNKHAADAAQARDATHDRLNRAPTGDDVPADDLPDRLRGIADDFRSKRK